MPASKPTVQKNSNSSRQPSAIDISSDEEEENKPDDDATKSSESELS